VSEKKKKGKKKTQERGSLRQNKETMRRNDKNDASTGKCFLFLSVEWFLGGSGESAWE